MMMLLLLHVVRRSVTAVVDFWQIKKFDFFNNAPEWSILQLPSFFLT